MIVCCWCGRRVRAGRLVPGWGYLLRPCLHVGQVRSVLPHSCRTPPPVTGRLLRAMAAECADDPDLLARVINRAKTDG